MSGHRLSDHNIPKLPSTVTNPSQEASNESVSQDPRSLDFDSKSYTESETPSVDTKPSESRLVLSKLTRCRKWILMGKMRRRTFYVATLLSVTMIAANIAGAVPQYNSAAYAKQTVQLTIAAGDFASHEATQNFLGQCLARKQANVTLGTDCTKYLALPPKAPPGADRWFEPREPQANNVIVRRRVVTIDDYRPQKSYIPSLESIVFWVMVSLAGYTLIYRVLGRHFGVAPLHSILKWQATRLVVVVAGAGALLKKNWRRAPWLLDSLNAGLLSSHEGLWFSPIVELVFVLDVIAIVYASYLAYTTYEVTTIATQLKDWAGARNFVGLCYAFKEFGVPSSPDCSKFIDLQLRRPPHAGSVSTTEEGVMSMTTYKEVKPTFRPVEIASHSASTAQRILSAILLIAPLLSCVLGLALLSRHYYKAFFERKHFASSGRTVGGGTMSRHSWAERLESGRGRSGKIPGRPPIDV